MQRRRCADVCFTQGRFLQAAVNLARTQIQERAAGFQPLQQGSRGRGVHLERRYRVGHEDCRLRVTCRVDDDVGWRQGRTLCGVCQVHLGALKSGAVDDLRRVGCRLGMELRDRLKRYAALFQVRERGKKVSPQQAARAGYEDGLVAQGVELHTLADRGSVVGDDVILHGSTVRCAPARRTA